MPLPVLPGVLRISVAGQVAGGGRWSNTWHARNVSLVDFTSSAIEAFHAIFAQIYLGPSVGGGTPVLAQCPALTTVDKFSYTPLDGSSGAFDVSGSDTGSGGVSTMPAEVAECLTIRTADRGRQNRGRVFFPAFGMESFDSAGHIKLATANLTRAQVENVGDALIAGGAEIGVASYGRSVNRLGVVHTWTPHFTPATQFSIDLLADVIRARKD